MFQVSCNRIFKSRWLKSELFKSYILQANNIQPDINRAEFRSAWQLISFGCTKVLMGNRVENLSNFEESIYNSNFQIRKYILTRKLSFWIQLFSGAYITQTKIHIVCKQHQTAINGIGLGLKEKKKQKRNYVCYLCHNIILFH